MTKDDMEFMSSLRGLAIFVVVFGHVGGFWVFRPYSEFLHVVIPIFFFLSGAVLFFSYERAHTLASYYIKRVLSLIIPYYLLCLLSLFIYLIINGSLPNINFKNIFLWLQVRPINEIMVFPVGQIWFLHTFLCIIFLSPFFFYLRKKYYSLLVIIMFLFITLSGTQLFFDISTSMRLFGNNFYKPLVHSSFFIFGIIFVSSPIIRKKIFLITSLLVLLSLSVLIANCLNLNVDYAYHIYAPDLYYVAGSFAAIVMFILLQDYVLIAVRSNELLATALLFFHRHTFSVYLLHSFVIYLSEELAWLLRLQEKSLVLYGLVKFVIVICITCLFSIPFSRFSVIIIEMLEKQIRRYFLSSTTVSATG